MTLSPRAGLKFLGNRLRTLVVGKPRELALRWGVLLGLVLILGWFVIPNLSAYYHSRQADSALVRHECAEARRRLERCLHVWPDNARLQFHMARCCWRENDPEAADQHLRQAARLGWPSKAIDVEGLLIEAQFGLPPPLEFSLSELLKFAHDDDKELESIVLEALVLALLRVERRLEAAVLAKALVAADPGQWRSQWLLGRAQELQDEDLAASAFLRSVELKPDQPTVHRWLALYSARKAYPRQTLEHLRAAGATDIEATLAAAKAHLLLGQFADARTALNRAWHEGAEQNPWAWTLRGRLELDEFGPEEATPWLTRAEALAPYNAETVDALIALAARQGNKEKVQHYLQRKQQSNAAGEEALALSRKMDRMYRQPDANPAEKEATAFRLGQLSFLTNHDEAGVKWMESVLADNPRHVGARRQLAEYYERIGARAQADEHRRGIVRQQDP